VKIDGRAVLAPLLAAAVLGLVIVQTMRAMERAGAWASRRQKTTLLRQDDPYVSLDHAIAAASSSPGNAVLRDPFVSGNTAPIALAPLRPRRVVPPGPPPVPVLTAIVWDNDPRALVRWNEHDYTVRANDLFDQFRVVSISREQVVLDLKGEPMILRRPHQGE
jgi:hypothetical protein